MLERSTVCFQQRARQDMNGHEGPPRSSTGRCSRTLLTYIADAIDVIFSEQVHIRLDDIVRVTPNEISRIRGQRYRYL